MKSVIIFLIVFSTPLVFADGIDWSVMDSTQTAITEYRYEITTIKVANSDDNQVDSKRYNVYDSLAFKLLPGFIIFSFIIVPIFYLYVIRSLNKEKNLTKQTKCDVK